MDFQNIHFCSDCFNLTALYVNQDKNLIHYCKLCEKEEEYKGNRCIFTQDFRGLNKSDIINQNKYINHDKTLPFIKDNHNIKCPNSECESNKGGDKIVKYVKHDYDNMKYTYICNECGQKWSN